MEETEALELPAPARSLLDRTFGNRWHRAEFKIMEGATNLVVRLRVGGAGESRDCALRVPRLDDDALRIDRYSEAAALRAAAAADLAPEMVACEPVSGVLITRWLEEDVWAPPQAAHPKRAHLLGQVLRRLHTLPLPRDVRRLQLGEILRAYWSLAEPRLRELPRKMIHLRDTALRLLDKRRPADERLCHNDLHCRNIVGVGEKVRLLDWEYSGIGEPLFDLASYAQSHDLGPESCQTLLEGYGIASDAVPRFIEECGLFDWTCALWLVASGEWGSAVGRGRFDLLAKRLQRQWK